MKINRFKIQGIQQDVNTTSTSEDSIIILKSSFLVESSIRGESDKFEIQLDDSDVMEIVLEDGTVWFSNAYTIDELFPEINVQNRDGESSLLPTFIISKDFNRGVFDKIIIKIINIFSRKVLAKNVKKIAASLENKQLDEHIGLFRLGKTFQFEPLIKQQDSNKYLLFIHGTASSINGSFGSLKDTALWNQLYQTYGMNILAFQHRTLTESPMENVLELIKSLPSNAELNIITHSRGGLIGDLLSRFCVLNEHNRGFTESEIHKLKKSYPEAYGKTLEKLIIAIGDTAGEKRIKINQFIRVACPAQGTTLASKRLDNTLNMLFNLVGISTGWTAAPVYMAFKNLVAAVVDCKNDPETLPGLEAMDPDSPFIGAMNSIYDADGITLDQPLIIISGNAKASVNLKGLLIIASKLFYKGKNDLIVNTDSMYRGTKRTKLVQYFLDEDQTVDHFSYFKNEKTQKAIGDALKSEWNTPISGFKELETEKAELERQALLKLDGGSLSVSKVSGTRPIVIIIPGIMGSNLSVNDDKIWINYRHFIFGNLDKISIDSKDKIEAKSIVKSSYNKITDHLLDNYDVITFAFDWRKSLNDSAKLFADKIKELMSFFQPIKIVAHSMGGVLVRDFMVTQNETWKKLNDSNGFRLIFLGSPLGGSFRIPTVLLGMDSIIDKLSKIDLKNNKKELIEIFKKFPGLLGLLPLTKEQKFNFGEIKTWQEMASTLNEWPVPNRTDLDNFNLYRNGILASKHIDYKNAVYIAGKADATPCGYRIDETSYGKELVFLYTGEGDESVTWDSGIPDEMTLNNTVYYVNVSHGSLANETALFAGIDELLIKGETDLLNKLRPAIRGDEKEFTIPPIFDFDLTERGVENTILGLSNNQNLLINEPLKLKIKVIEGDLKYSTYPVIAGHFNQDGILYAEKAIDQCMKGTLSERHKLGIYPGEIGSNEILVTQNEDFKGTIIIGLGEPGTLTANTLSKSIQLAITKYLVNLNNERLSTNYSTPGKGKIGITSITIGCGYGGLSIESSVRAILTGILNANEKIISMYTNGVKTIEELEIVEQYEDRAIASYYALVKLVKEKSMYNITIASDISIKNGAKRRFLGDKNDEWSRINITKINDDHFEGLKFTISTGGAREEQRNLYINNYIIKSLFNEISQSNRWTADIAKTIFEFLIPNDFKLQLKRHSNIIWIVDEHTAWYPWELLHDGVNDTSPLCINAGMIRQLSTPNYRLRINIISNRKALVIADPMLDGRAFQLPAAKKEGEMVYSLLSDHQFETISKINSNALDIFKCLSSEYKIIHFAGHGVFDENSTMDSGMLIGKDCLLTTKDIANLSSVPEFVFVNCCFLGHTDGNAENLSQKRYQLAANIGTQLINNGVKAVIAAGWAIDDQAALEFTKMFYEKMLSGYTFGESTLAARRYIYERFNQNNTWGAYQCYGDPFYKFDINSRTEKTTHFDFIVPEKAEIELFNLHNEIETNRYSQSEYFARLKAISESIDKSGIRNQNITEKEALIYADMGDYDTSIQIFEQLLNYPKACYMVSSLEKYFSVRAKKCVKEFTHNGKNISKQFQEISELIKNISTLSDIGGQTVDRLSLIASTYKRKALLTNKQSDKKEALIKSAEHYMYAHEKQKSISAVHCLTNWYEIQIILVELGFIQDWKFNIKLGNKTYSVKSQLDAIKQLNVLKDKILAETNDGNFWNSISLVNIRLCILILDPKNKNNSIQDLINSYRNVWNNGGSRGKKLSEIEHLEFIILSLSNSEKADIKLLITQLQTIKSELEHLL